MTTSRKNKLIELLRELREDRLTELEENGYDVDNIRDIYEIDDGDNLLEGIDIILCTLGAD